MSVICYHNAGFFSCCSVKLENIIFFINKNKKLPRLVDSSRQFKKYKNSNRDVTFKYFKHYNSTKNINIISKIEYKNNYQFRDYSKLQYHLIVPIVNKYFHPSKTIIQISKKLKKNIILNLKNQLQFIIEVLIKKKN